MQNYNSVRIHDPELEHSHTGPREDFYANVAGGGINLVFDSPEDAVQFAEQLRDEALEAQVPEEAPEAVEA